MIPEPRGRGPGGSGASAGGAATPEQEAGRDLSRADGAPRLALAATLACGAALPLAGRQPAAAAAALAALFGAVFVVLAVIDIESRRIPNAIVLPALALAVASAWAWPERGAAEGLAGEAVALAPMWVVFWMSRGGFGGGDVKMAALVGAVAGYPAALTALLVATGSAGIGAVVLLAVRSEGRRATLPYGPFLALGGWPGCCGDTSRAGRRRDISKDRGWVAPRLGVRRSTGPRSDGRGRYWSGPRRGRVLKGDLQVRLGLIGRPS